MSIPSPSTEASGIAGSELKSYVLQYPDGRVYGVGVEYGGGFQFVPFERFEASRKVNERRRLLGLDEPLP